ncbi:MAG: amidohydrolase family protein [Phycisphaerae bacterium]|nr:amidohydrolase family protein [Phycisphaerae bacterium]
MADNDPHAPDVRQRQTVDDGFSAGWGRHFLPAEEFVIDCHMHIDGKEPWMVRKSLDLLFGTLAAYRLDQAIVVDGGPGSLDWLAQVARTDRRFHFMIWMKPENPDVEFLRRARQAGAVGVKLHNSPIMAGQFEPGVWESPGWQRVFAAAEELAMPVLWHVTQVEAAAPYIGEGPGNALASRRAKGSTLSNAGLLAQFLRIVARYQGITFVGAHQLYLGDAKLAELFAAHPNLAIDTSCGYFLRWGDRMLDEDAAAAREFLCAWPDRVLFATDNTMGAAHCNEVHFEAFRCHLRYLRALRLPQDVLDRIAWQNARRVFALPEGDDWMTATTRP